MTDVQSDFQSSQTVQSPVVINNGEQVPSLSPKLTNFEKFKSLTTNEKHLPKIKNIHVIKPLTQDPIVELKSTSQKVSQKKSALNPIHFIQYHNRNLELIKKLSRKYNLSHNRENKREETSMERFNKIKKYFNIDSNKESIREEEYKPKIKIKQSPYPKIKDKTFYYQIIRGNNSELITKCFKHRLNWKDFTQSPISLCQSEIDLIWSPTSGSITFTNLIYEKEKENVQMVNHFEFHLQISNKMKLFANMMKYCEAHSLDVWSYIPFTIQIQYENTNFLKQFNSFSYLFTHISNFLDKNTKARYKDYFYVEPLNDKIGAKTPIYIQKNHYTDKNLWLIKAVNLNRGRCIKIADSVESAESIIKHFYQGVMKGFKDGEKEDEENKNNSMRSLILPKINFLGTSNNNSNSTNIKLSNQKKVFPKIDYSVINSKTLNKIKYQSSLVILQKYIEKPLLYYERKFDMRIWVLLTHKMEVYFFKEGHLKATSVKYDIGSKNSFVHLTNYSVQKYNENFSKFEYGNEISFNDFEAELYNDLKVPKDVRKEIIPKVAEIIKISMKSVKESININERKFCFEIFGYDFMFDCDINPFLIEVNTNPGLEISSPLISELVPRMIDDSLRLTIDEIFVPEYEWGDAQTSYQSPFHVNGYSDEENMWELVCDLSKEDGKKR